MNFLITEIEDPSENPYKYCAVCTDVPDALFSGRGETLHAAFGECLCANREVLNFTFEIHRRNGDVELSTASGQSRKVYQSMEFQNVNIGGLFNTMDARWAKISDTEAVCVLSSVIKPGFIREFSKTEFAIVLWH